MTKILFAGDFYPVKEVESFVKNTHTPEVLFGDLLEIIADSDIAAYNQEYPFTTSNKKILKFGPNLKGNPICVDALKNAGFNLACLANNHSYDYGDEGIIENRENLKRAGIDYTGVGLTKVEATKIYYKKINDIVIGIINLAENEFNTATQKHGGANPLDIVDNTYLIYEAKKSADFVFLVIHGGTDFCHYPSPRMVKQYRFYADQGADAIIGHHTHYVSGYEVYNGVPIFYSLGNLIYPFNWGTHRNETLVVQFELTKGKNVLFKYYPLIFDTKKMKLRHMQPDYYLDFNQRFKEYCLTIKDSKLLQQKWKEHVEAPVNRTVYWTLLAGKPYLLYRVAKKLKAFNLLEKILIRRKNKYLGLWNLIRCETHRDAVLNHFENLFSNENN